MRTGERTHGFVVRREVPLAELDGVLWELEHEGTGLRLAWLDRPEENKTFGIAFTTLPHDDTGVFHILEHSVLCGSRRYPVKEPFVELVKGSMNTFLNALTFPDKTVYPISSKSAADFMNLMRVYLDAAFEPALYERPEIFRQEGWRYELADDGSVSRQGVVLNEMRGALSDADTLAEAAVSRALFPDTPYRFVSGGDPAAIPGLTYEAFVETHRRCYSPSNAYVFLDGAIDVDEVLRVMDEEYLSALPRAERLAPPALQAPVDGGVSEVAYEVGAGEDTSVRTRVVWGSVIGTYADRERIVATQALAAVLAGGNEAPLAHALLSRGLAQDVSMRVEDSLAQPWLRLDVRDLAGESREEVERVVRETLERVCEEGLDEGQLVAALANIEFRMRERDWGQGYPQGLMLGFQMLDSWLYGGAPEANLEVGDLFDRLRGRMGTGWYEGLLRELTIGSAHRCEVVMTPSRTVGAERRAAERAELDAEVTGWDDARRAEVEEQGRARADLPAEPDELPCARATLSGVPALLHDLPCGGIAYVSLYFDAEDLGEESLSALALACEALGQIATRRRPAIDLMARERLLCGSLSFDVRTYGGEGDLSRRRTKLVASFSALEQNLGEACDLVLEVLGETRLDDADAVLDVCRQSRSALFRRICSAGHAAALGRVAAQLTPVGVADERTGGVELYRWLRACEDAWADEGAVTCAELVNVVRRVVRRPRLTLSVTGEAASLAPALAERLAAALPEGNPVGRAAALAPWGPRREGVVVPVDVSFAARGGDLLAAGAGYGGAAQLAARAVSLAYLWDAVRVRGGAYGCGMVVRPNGVVGCYSYRDPNASRSLETFAGAGEFLGAYAAGEPDLTSLVAGAVSDASPLLTPRAKGATSDAHFWQGLTWERRREMRRELLACAPADLALLAGPVGEALSSESCCVVGPAPGLDVTVTL